MKRDLRAILATLLSVSMLVSCTYNPFTTNNEITGSPGAAAIGAIAAGGGAALLSAPKSVIAAMGLGGGMFGYYVTTLRFDAAGIIHAGGQVYKIGDLIGIYIPSDELFESNTADFKPFARSILESVATVLFRYPNNSIIVSGNTSGFGRARWEQKLSEERAKRVAGILWDLGINGSFPSLTYVGYGDYFRIAHSYTNDGIRANSRIQIVSYPINTGKPIDIVGGIQCGGNGC